MKQKKKRQEDGPTSVGFSPEGYSMVMISVEAGVSIEWDATWDGPLQVWRVSVAPGKRKNTDKGNRTSAAGRGNKK